MEVRTEGPPVHTEAICDDNTNVFISPYAEKAKDIIIPNVSVPELFFQAIDMNYDIIKEKVWVTDCNTGISYKFREIKPVARKIASALTRLGFKKGDVLVFMTQNQALLYLVNIGVWLCGGAVRGCCPEDRKEVHLVQMREVSARFVLCDPQITPSVKWATEQLGWNVSILSIGGAVEGALSIEEMLEQEDCSAFPEDVKINPKEDTWVIINTSGSTGTPKGVIQTHRSLVTYLTLRGLPRKIEEKDGVAHSSLMIAAGNFFASLFINSATTIVSGYSFYASSTFEIELFMKSLLKYKPEGVFLHPYAVHAFVQHPEIKNHDFSFLKIVLSGGSVFNYATAKALEAQLPHVKLMLKYGISETLAISSTMLDMLSTTVDCNHEDTVAGVKFNTFQGDTHMACGFIEPLLKAKIVDVSSGRSLGRYVKGNLLVKTPYFMKGYVTNEENKNKNTGSDDIGWFDTGDLAYFDEDDFLYVVDRTKFTFKYYMHWVSPTEVEAIILMHPAVVSAVVVGVPDPMTTSLTKAFVVLKPGTKVTEEEIKVHVAENAQEDYKQLHGGVSFVDTLPTTPGGKLDRNTLLKQAIAEMRPST